MKYYYRGILFVLWISFLSYSQMNAQQLPLFNQHRTSLNPAYITSGFFKYNMPTTVAVKYRHQWTKVEGAPRTVLANFYHLNEEKRFSFGGDFISDETGPTGFTGIYGRASYTIKLSRDLLLSFGLRGGATQYRVQGDNLQFLVEGDLANNNASKIYPDFSLGTMLYWQENYFVGFSIPQIFALDLTFKDDINRYNMQRVRHYYGIAGARFDLGNDSWFESSVEARYVRTVPFYVSAKAEYEFRQIFWINAVGSSSKEFGIGFGAIANIGTNSNLVKFGYNFSNFFQAYGPDFGTVHELSVRLHL